MTKETIKKIDESHLDFDKFKYIIKRLRLECRRNAIREPQFYVNYNYDGNGKDLVFHAVGMNDEDHPIDMSLYNGKIKMVDHKGWRGCYPSMVKLDMMLSMMTRIMVLMHKEFKHKEKFGNLYLSMLSYREEPVVVCTSYMDEPQCIYGAFSIKNNIVKPIDFGWGW